MLKKGYFLTFCILLLMLAVLCSCSAEDNKESNTTDTQPHTEHSFSAWVTAKEATCTSEGKLISGCTVCGVQQEKPLEKADHKYATYKVNRVEENVEEITYVCTAVDCDKSYVERKRLTVYTQEQLVEKAKKYVAEISAFDKDGAIIGKELGVFCEDNGKILVSYHLIKNAYSVSVYMGEKDHTIGFVDSIDEDNDIAVLNMGREAQDKNAIKRLYDGVEFNGESIPLGSKLYAIGIDSCTEGDLEAYGENEGATHIIHTASIEGNSKGGALVNKCGELIGIFIPAAEGEGVSCIGGETLYKILNMSGDAFQIEYLNKLMGGNFSGIKTSLIKNHCYMYENMIFHDDLMDGKIRISYYAESDALSISVSKIDIDGEDVSVRCYFEGGEEKCEYEVTVSRKNTKGISGNIDIADFTRQTAIDTDSTFEDAAQEAELLGISQRAIVAALEVMAKIPDCEAPLTELGFVSFTEK